MARKPALASARARFAGLLREHLAKGTRPATAAGEPWTFAEFASEVPSPRTKNAFASDRSVSNWCNGRALPEEIDPILRALFGPIGPNQRHAAVRDALRAAFIEARVEEYTSVVTSAKPDAAGSSWVAEGGQLYIDRTTAPSDEAAAADPLRQQLQTAICDIAAELAEAGMRVSNTRTWGKLSATAKALHTLTESDPLSMPTRLGDAYASMLRLGRFLDTDIRLQHDDMASDGPLGPEVHGPLADLVRLAAPWLRGFPTVAAWDDAGGKMLMRAELFKPAREIARIAREKQAISNRDADEMELLADSADASDFLGEKAGARVVGGVQNLIVTAAGIVGGVLSGVIVSDIAADPLLVRRASELLETAEKEVEALVATVPVDLRHALLGIIKEGRLRNLVADGESTHHQAGYGIKSIRIGNDVVAVTEETLLQTAFGTLLRFHKSCDTVQPRVLIVAPASGDFIPFLRDTVSVLLPDQDVYITKWKNARDIPLSKGIFGFDEYVDHLIRFMEVMGEGGHMIAICQPAVAALAATAVMAETGNRAQPRSLTLMAGPIDTRQNPTKANELAKSRPIEWFEKNLIATVPRPYKGVLRRVRSACLPKVTGMSLDPHVTAHIDELRALACGDLIVPNKDVELYGDRNSGMDVPAELYLETVQKVFQDHDLPLGKLTWRGEPVRPQAIRRTALLTVEGERDDICPIGQTMAALDLCSGLRNSQKRHHLQAGVGHYDLFSGPRWAREVYPRVRAMIEVTNQRMAT